MPAFGLALIVLLAVLLAALRWLRRRRAPLANPASVAATTWLSLRRLVSLGMAALLLAGAARNLYLATGASSVRHLLYAAFGLALAGMAYLFGRYGKVSRYSSLETDRQVHETRRIRNGWRW